MADTTTQVLMETNAPLHTYLENWSAFTSSVIEFVLIWALVAMLAGLYLSIKTIGFLRKNHGFYRPNILWHLLAKIHFLLIPLFITLTLTALAATFGSHRYYKQYSPEFFTRTVTPTLYDIHALMASTPADGRANRLDSFINRLLKSLHRRPKSLLEQVESNFFVDFNRAFHFWFIQTISSTVASYALIQSNVELRSETNLFQPHLIRTMNLTAVAGAIEKQIQDKADTQLQETYRAIYRSLGMAFGIGFSFIVFEFGFARLFQTKEQS